MRIQWCYVWCTYKHILRTPNVFSNQPSFFWIQSAQHLRSQFLNHLALKIPTFITMQYSRKSIKFSYNIQAVVFDIWLHVTYAWAYVVKWSLTTRTSQYFLSRTSCDCSSPEQILVLVSISLTMQRYLRPFPSFFAPGKTLPESRDPDLV